jgi:predicted NAD-dependent protein-ADP-ribosyltransferase YbiA (DUF1768 family)
LIHQCCLACGELHADCQCDGHRKKAHVPGQCKACGRKVRERAGWTWHQLSESLEQEIATRLENDYFRRNDEVKAFCLDCWNNQAKVKVAVLP